MDERYTNSLIDSATKYLFNLEYLGNNDRVTLRALGTFKILHQLYSWADWFEVCEDKKIKMEQLINCIIMRNSNLILPTIIPGPYYSNVSTPQTIYTWQKVYDMPNVQVHEDLDPVDRITHYLAVQASNSEIPVAITVSKTDITGEANGNTAFLRTYFDGEEVRLTAPATLSNNNTFVRWRLDGVDQVLGTRTLDVTMNAGRTAIAQYATYVPVTGSITINKIVTTHTGVQVDESTLFEVSITNGNITRTGFIGSDLPITFSDLPLGTFTVSEVPSSKHNLISIVSSPITLTTEVPNRIVTITNAQKEPAGTITINKVILLNGEQDLTDTTSFSITVTDGETTFTGEVTQATPLVFTNVPIGVYSVVETVPMYYQLVSSPILTVAVTESEPNGIATVVNEHTPVVGTITITKVVKDENGNIDPTDTTEFTVTASNSVNALWTGVVSSGIPYIMDNLSPGEYIITESDKEGYQLDSIITTPVIITTESLTHNVEITNSKLPPQATGTITINKRVQDYTDVIKYGALYNWYAATDARLIANSGWHVSTEQDWIDLKSFTNQDAYKLIEVGGEHWNPLLPGASNTTGFTARPNGFRTTTGLFGGLGTTAQYWSDKVVNTTDGSMFVISNSVNVLQATLDKRYGGAIRLVKDSTTLSNGQIGTYVGNDGKVYKTICIGTKEWVIENLFETKFRNGNLISLVPSSTWTSLASAGMCYYNNDIANTTKRGIGLIADETSFTTTVTDGVTPSSKEVTYIIPAVHDTLEFGNYTISETQKAGYQTPIIEPASAILSLENTNQLVTITNTKIPEVGSITVNKTVLNTYGDKVYEFEYIATGTGVNPLVFSAHGSTSSPAVFSDLPLDTYTITEVPNPDYPLVSITPGSCTLTTLNPDQSVDVVNGNTNPEFGYGLLYNWWAANNENGITSDKDWVLPSVGDYTNLGIALGGNAIAGGKMKLPGYTYWNSPNTGASNSSGFNAVGAGGRSAISPSNFEQELAFTSYWTSNEFDADKSSLVALSFSSGTLIIDQYPPDKFGLSKNTGVSIRLRKLRTDLLDGQIGIYIGNDKQVYNTICIDGVEWLSENLRETKYKSGDTIPNVTNGITWATLRTGALCAYNNDPSNI